MLILKTKERMDSGEITLPSTRQTPRTGLTFPDPGGAHVHKLPLEKIQFPRLCPAQLSSVSWHTTLV